jgi:hypothetical protein
MFPASTYGAELKQLALAKAIACFLQAVAYGLYGGWCLLQAVLQTSHLYYSKETNQRIKLTCVLCCAVFVPCRLSTISLLFLPALAWVGFNMLQPATNQLNRMNELKEAAAGSSAGRKKRGVAGAVGLGAALSLFAAQNADAATELSQLAASDNRWAKQWWFG